MYYIGFLKRDPRHAVVFKSIVTPKKEDYTYFVRVIGSYSTESEARTTLSVLKRAYGYYENPAVSERQRKFMCAELGRKRAGKRTKTTMTEQQLRDFCMKRKKNPAKVISHKQAYALTKKILVYAKKLYRHEQKGMKVNPGVNYHQQRFLYYMSQLEKYVVGSKPYVELLAKAYAHLESVKASR